MADIMRKSLFPSIAVLLVAAGLVYAFWPRPIPVALTTVERGPMLVTIEDEGETRVKEAYTISAPLSGRVARFDGHVGDSIAAGLSVVATIRPSQPAFHDIRTHSELQAAVKAAEAARDLARAHVASAAAANEFAQAEFKRGRNLAERGTMSRSGLDRARMEARTKKADLNESRAALRVREFQLQTAQAATLGPASAQRTVTGDLCCFEVRAPVSGTILRVFQESEAVVQAGAPLVEIGNPADLEIVVDLLSTDAVLVSPGNDVLIEGWGGKRSLKGRVRRIEPFGFTKTSSLGIDEQRVNVIIDFADPPARWKKLGHGYRVISRIVIWRGTNILQAPLSALFRAQDAWALFKVINGRARLSKVEIGRMNSRSAEIRSGLDAGDKVLLHPSDRIEEGVRTIDRVKR